MSTRRLLLRNGTWYYRRRIPAVWQERLGRKTDTSRARTLSTTCDAKPITLKRPIYAPRYVHT